MTKLFMMKEKQIRSVSSLHCFNYKIFMTDLIIDIMPWYDSYLIFRNYIVLQSMQEENIGILFLQGRRRASQLGQGVQTGAAEQGGGALGHSAPPLS